MNAPVAHIPRVMIVEDDDGDALLVERALSRSEFRSSRASNRQTALAQLAAGDYDAALLDLSLPDSFGLEGVDSLHLQFPDLPIVVVTGLADSVLALAALQHGAQDYLVKCDWTPSLLVRTLRHAIQRQQLQVEKRRLLEELARQARHDSLTGLLNRRSFLEELIREWSRACRGRPLSCVMLDVDYFKKVNDTYGHAAGDSVLKAIADMLLCGCRATDVAGRYGGEEFCILLPDTTEESALLWAERMRKRIAETPITVGDEQIQVTASFGVAEKRDSVTTVEALIEQADLALRLAKQLGRDRVLPAGGLSSRTGRTTAVPSRDLFAQAHATELLSPVIATLPPTAVLEEAAQHLLGWRVDCVPVVDEAGNLLGTVSEVELSSALSSQRNWSKSVADVMIRKPPCFGAWVDAAVIRDFLARTGARHVVIVEGQRPIGTVSQFGILRWLAWQAASPEGAAGAMHSPIASDAALAASAELTSA